MPLILADLAAELPAAEWPRGLLLRPRCAGAGRWRLAAKAQGFEVYASDRARRGAIVAAALIANSSVQLREADWLPALRPDDLRANGAAAVSVFTPAQARRIDGLLTAAAARQAPTRALLELLAIQAGLPPLPDVAAQRHGRGARGGGGVPTRSPPRRLGHYLRRDRWIQPAGLRTLATAINGGVIGGRGHATQRDAHEAIAASPTGTRTPQRGVLVPQRPRMRPFVRLRPPARSRVRALLVAPARGARAAAVAPRSAPRS